MSPKVSLPKIDARKANDLLRQLRGMAPHYTKEWPAKDESDPGVALLKIFSFIAEGVISRLNRAPERNFLAFLDMLGIRLLPATAARAPVRFLVANGTEDSFIVRKGVQVSAPATETRPTELPFETIENLLVIPAALMAVLAVDPELDHIYRPPPEFLALKTAASKLPALRVTAFSAAESTFLQLDPSDQIKEGDFLRIEQPLSQGSGVRDCLPTVNPAQAHSIDHLVVSAVKGPIVTLRDKLPRDYLEGTGVQKVTKFELFEAKNWQEHVLYLAHSQYFAIKSEAKITLLVEHAPGASSNLQTLNLIWEFFGVIEADPEKKEGWHEFEVDLDGTRGFSRDGQVILIKPAGEIKETPIEGKKNRWIRARLKDALPATPPRPLPKIESITFAVASGGKNLAADQAFHNDTPLTTNLKFFPFGTEPRIFDRFSIASEEAFSKPGAQVVLNLQLDFTDLLASPIAIFQSGTIRAFAHGAAGRLVEFEIKPVSSSDQVISHATPTDRRLVGGLSPAVVVDASQAMVGVFARADDNHIHLRYIPTANQVDRVWIDLKDAKLAGEMRFSPAAVLFNLKWRVYVIADSGVQFREVDPLHAQDPGDWTEVTSSNPLIKPAAASTPFAVVVQSGATKIWLAVTDEAGHTWTHDGTTWRDLPRPSDSFLAAENARPYIVPYPVGLPATDVRVFVRNAQGELVSFTIKLSDNSVTTQTWGAPGGGVLVASNPSVNPAGTHVFVRGSDNQLWARDLSLVQWKPHTNSLDATLAGDPYVLSYNPIAGNPADVVSVLSTSDKNLLLEFRVPGADVEVGQIKAGPKDILLLQNVLTAGPTYFVEITSGTASNSSEDATRKIVSIQNKVALLAKPLGDIPRADTRYAVYEQKEPGNTAAASTVLNKVQLQASTTAAIGDHLFVGLELREVVGKAGDVVTLASPLTSLPPLNAPYVVLKRIATAQEAGEGSARQVVLAAGLTPPANAYVGLFLEVVIGGAQVIRRIAAYDSTNRGVVLEQDLPDAPLPNANYKITVGSLPEGWQAYRDPDQTELRPELSWEYWNGKGWVFLPVADSTDKFLVPGTVVFILPEDIKKTEVAGQENYWIRARIVGGDYGRELFRVDPKTNKITIEKDPIRPPLVKALGISYTVTEMKPPQFCLAFNNLNYLDQTAANIREDKHFNPFLTLADTDKTVYFGFDKSFRSGPVRIYFAAKELEVDESRKPKLRWEFARDNEWMEIAADDDTNAFTRPEFVSLVLPERLQNRQQFGQTLYWLRATLTEGSWTKSPLFEGVFINTVQTLQARTVSDEILGSSTGVKNQMFRFQQLPVIEGEEIRVREVLTDEERERLIAESGEEAVLTLKDQQDRVLETWIRWTEVSEFFKSEAGSRHYRLDRAMGEVEFGDGVRGRIPPAGGDNIKAFAYQAGGGAGGNVLPGEINSPVTAVAGVDSVINPVAGGGGSDKATNDDMLKIGPEQIGNRGRAVTPDDFEQLAREASREVRKALCLPNRNAVGRHESGWTSVHIVPDSKDAEPMPSLELRRVVQRHLAERADVTLVDQDHIFVGAPKYVPVNVEATIFAKSLDVAATAEQRVRQKLEAFLHPLTGGPTGEGWEFGRDLAASDLYALLEDIDEVDHVEALRLVFGESESVERVSVDDDALLAGGTPRIEMRVARENR